MQKLPVAASPIIRLGRKRTTKRGKPVLILLAALLSSLTLPPTFAYLEQPFSGTAANSGSIRLLLHFNEASGTMAADASQFANNGTLSNFPASPWTGTALNFDGTNDFVSVLSASSLNVTTALSLEAWVNVSINNPATPLTILSKWDETNGRRAYLLRLGANRKVQFLLSSDGTADPGKIFTAASAAALTINTWYHVSASYDGTTMRILINGVVDGTLTGPASVFVSPAVVRVGAQGDAASAAQNFFQGALDEARVLDYARSDYSQYHIYHFNESGTTPPADFGGYNHAAALTGAPTYTTSGARFGNGLSLNGTSQYATALYIGPDESWASSALTLEAWITTTTVAAGSRTIVTAETAGNTWMKLRQSGPNLQLLVKTGASSTLTSAGTLTAGALTHVAGTWDGATMRLFINGAQDANTLAKTGSIPQVNRSFQVGAGTGPSEFFSGTIDEVRVLTGARAAFNAGAVVNEIALAPPSGNQWIEIYNGGGVTLDLAGWVFKNTSDASTYTVPASGTRTIAPGAYVVIELGSGTDTASTYFTANDPGNSLLSGDLAGTDSLSVYPSSTVSAARIIDYVAWGAAPSSADNGIAAGLWARGSYVGVAPTAQSIGLLANGNDEEGWRDWGGLTPMTRGATNGTATAAGVMALYALPQEDGVVVRWATSLEPHHVGFNLYRAGSENGPLAKVNDALILGRPGSPFGGTYVFKDPAGSRGDWYQLEDLDTVGGVTRHPAVEAGAPDSEARSLLQRVEAGARLAPVPAMDAFAAAPRQASSAAPSHLNLPLISAGLYRVDVAQVASQLGIQAGRSTDLVISEAGTPVPVRWIPASAGKSAALEFYAASPAGKYSGERVYQIAPRAAGTSVRFMKQRSTRPVSTSEPVETFMGSARADENRLYFIASPEEDLFFRDIVTSQKPDIVIPLSTPGLAAGAVLRADLVGMTEAPGVPRNHHAQIRLNGQLVYEGFFHGVESHRVDVPIPDGLIADRNTLEIRALADVGSTLDVFLVNWIEIVSPHPLKAVSNRLDFTASGAIPVRLGGFTRPDIRILDVTRPRAAVSLARFVVRSEPDGTYSALFQDAPGSTLRHYLAVAGDAIAAAPWRAPVPAGDLRSSGNRAAYLVITRSELAGALEPLLARRRAEGLETKVVDVEAIYDQFGFGNKSPEAIRDFVKAASGWATPPRYLLLAGGASFDPRNYLGTGWQDGVPTKLFRTRTYHYEAADDGYFASSLPAGAPGIAVGRLPAQGASELASAVAKIVEFETLQGALPLGRSLFVADDKNARSGLDDPSFGQTSALLAAGLAGTGVEIQRLDLSASADPRGDLLAAMAAGVDLINFIGHGGPQVWTSRGILASADAANLPNGPGSYFTVFSMTCFDGAFTYPYGDSLAWSLVKVPGKGAVAAYSPSTILDPLSHLDLDRLLLDAAFRNGPVRLGDLIRQVEGAIVSHGPNHGDAVDSFNLIGDPAQRISWSQR